MSAQYPGAVKTFTTKNAGDTIQPADVNDLQDEVNAIEDGLLNGSARLNSSHSTVATLSVVGNSTLASSITIGTVGYVFPASAPTSSGQVLTVSSTGTANTLTWQNANGAFTLLKANAGSDATAAATTVDSIALSGLTALDTLKVIVETFCSSQAAGNINLYSVTDSTNVILVAAPVANEQVTGEGFIVQDHVASTTYGAHINICGSVGGSATRTARYSAATAWTGSWTLGLRHGGVTAGGTFHYRWAVYKLAGQ